MRPTFIHMLTGVPLSVALRRFFTLGIVPHGLANS